MGDNVLVSIQSAGNSAIEDVLPRRTALIRSAPTARGDYKQILLANPDQIILVYACAQPDPHLRMLDRFLVICERQQIPAIINANKVDLVSTDQATHLFEKYKDLGYPVIYSSAKNNIGITELKDS